MKEITNHKAIEQFLQELNILRKEYEMLKDREERFNIFSALHKDHDERRLHSRFLSVLLQPKGTHGKGRLFLESFIALTNCSDQLLEGRVDVYPTERDKSENANIDILIINKETKHCLIIENKIYAGDSNLKSGGQIERYINHVKKEERIPEENISVIYLTLDAHDPSPKSLGAYKDWYEVDDSKDNEDSDQRKIVNWSYKSEIQQWLGKCLKEVVTEPFLRESIVQYQKLLRKMTGDEASKKERLAYKDLIGKNEESLDSAKALFENFKHVKWHATNEFWSLLQDKVDKDFDIVKRYNIDSNDNPNDVITALTHFEEYRVGQKKKQQCYLDFKCGDLIVSARFKGEYHRFYFGIPKKKNESALAQEVAKELLKTYPEYRATPTMLLSKDFNKDLRFNNFLVGDTFDIINQDKSRTYVKESFKELERLCNRIKGIIYENSIS